MPSEQPGDIRVVNRDFSNEETHLRVAIDTDTGMFMLRSQLMDELRGGFSEGNLKVSDVPPDQELVFSQTDWSGGAGEYENHGTETNRYHYSINLDGRTPGRIHPSLDFTPVSSATWPSTTPTNKRPVSDIIYVVEGASSQYNVAVGSETVGQDIILGRADTSTMAFTGDVAVATGSASYRPFGRLAHYDAYLCVACGGILVPDATPRYVNGDVRFYTTYMGASPSGGTNFTTNLPGLWWTSINNKLVLVNAANRAFVTDDLTTTTPVVADFDSGSDVLGKQAIFGGATSWMDSIVVASLNGVGSLDGSGQQVGLFPNMDVIRLPGSGKIVDAMGSMVLYNAGTAVYMLSDRDGWVDTGVTRMPNVPWFTRPQAAAPSSKYFYIIVGDGDVGYYLCSLDMEPPYRIHTLSQVSSPVAGYRMLLKVVGGTDGPVLVHNGDEVPANAGLKLNWVRLGNEKSTSEHVAPYNRVKPSGKFETPWINMGFESMIKSYLRVKVTGHRAYAASSTRIYYVLDNHMTATPGATTGWTLLATLQGTGNFNQTVSFPASVKGRRIKLMMEVDDGSNVLAYTSSITSWTLFAVPNFERRRYWEVVVNVSKNLAQTNMGRPREFGLDDLRERIQNMVDAELPLLVYWPDGTSSNVKLKSANFQLKSVQRRPNLVQANSEWVYTLGFMETKYGE